MTTQKLKDNLIAYLTETNPDADQISIADKTARATFDLPMITVDVPSAEAHSIALCNVQRCEVEITLRCHSGDEPEAEIPAWQDVLESVLNDPSRVKSACANGIRMDFWNYDGSETTWDESTMETRYTATCLVTRI